MVMPSQKQKRWRLLYPGITYFFAEHMSISVRILVRRESSFTVFAVRDNTEAQLRFELTGKPTL